MEIALFILRVLLIAAAYAFLGVLLWALVRERRATTPDRPAVPVARLEHLADGEAGRGYEVRSAAWLGRDPNCLVRVEDEFASARHAQVLWRAEEQAWFIEDNLSRNGTFLNGERVARAALRDGDAIRIGRADFRFSAKPPTR